MFAMTNEAKINKTHQLDVLCSGSISVKADFVYYVDVDD